MHRRSPNQVQELGVHHLAFGSRTLAFTLLFRQRKSLGIQVYPDGTVKVLAPFGAAYEDVLKKLVQKAGWVVKQLDEFEKYRPATPPRRFVSGETHQYLGRQYRLKIIADTQNCVKAYRGQLWLHATDTKPLALKAQLDAWYRHRAGAVFNELLQEVLPKFKRYKIGEPKLFIRTMQKRWGSCTVSGKIILNAELIKASKGCIEYVLVHELCHLVHRNHTTAFQQLLSQLLPDWTRRKERLEQGGFYFK